jgi:hypothetical protein
MTTLLKLASRLERKAQASAIEFTQIPVDKLRKHQLAVGDMEAIEAAYYISSAIGNLFRTANIDMNDPTSRAAISPEQATILFNHLKQSLPNIKAILNKLEEHLTINYK